MARKKPHHGRAEWFPDKSYLLGLDYVVVVVFFFGGGGVISYCFSRFLSKHSGKWMLVPRTFLVG